MRRQETKQVKLKQENVIQPYDGAQISSVSHFMMLNWPECFLEKALTGAAEGEAVRCFVHF